MTNSHVPSADTAESKLCASVSFRAATSKDTSWIEELEARCFGPGRFARTAFRVRERFPKEPKLSLVAEIGGEAVSSVAMTPISIGGVKGYLLGPLATDPVHRGQGAARFLVAEVTRQGLALGAAEFVLLVGDENYYGSLGFKRTKPGAIIFPGPVDPLRVLVHAAKSDLAETLGGAIAAFDAD